MAYSRPAAHRALAASLGILALLCIGGTPRRALFLEGERAFRAGDTERARPLLERYARQEIRSSPSEELLDVVDMLGTLYLRVDHDPERAITELGALRSSAFSRYAIADELEEWLAGAAEWKRFMDQDPPKIQASDRFSLALRYYDEGTQRSLRHGNSGNAYYALAVEHLGPFVITESLDERAGCALYLMGRIRAHDPTLSAHLATIFYFKEVIRRFPHTPIAERAWTELNAEVRLGYTGSSGDHTPASVREMLDRLHGQAVPAGTIATSNECPQ